MLLKTLLVAIAGHGHVGFREARTEHGAHATAFSIPVKKSNAMYEVYAASSVKVLTNHRKTHRSEIEHHQRPILLALPGTSSESCEISQELWDAL